MGTEVLHPQDCLRIQRIRVAPAPVVFNRRKSYYYGNGNGNGSVNPRLNNNNNNNNSSSISNSNYRKVRRSPEPVTGRRSDGKAQTQVTILKRGESVDFLKRLDDRTRNGDVVYGTAERLGPSPAVLPKQIRFTPSVGGGGDTYAGSAFSLSPSPRALPLPSFFSKKQESHDSATEGLRRLLRLE